MDFSFQVMNGRLLPRRGETDTARRGRWPSMLQTPREPERMHVAT